MDHVTECVGRIDIEPALSQDELDHLATHDAWREWAPCRDGCCLALTSVRDPVEPDAVLRHLIQEFLKPGATASRGDDALDLFTFDHRLDGMVVASDPADGRIFAITVTANRVTERTLRHGSFRLGGAPHPAYDPGAAGHDRDRGRRGRSGQPGPAGAVVIDLASRRA